MYNKFKNTLEYGELKKAINMAFREIRKTRKDAIVKQNFMCCQGCGWAEISATKTPDKHFAIFYNKQDNNNLKERGKFYLSYGVVTDEIEMTELMEKQLKDFANEVCSIFRKHNLKVIWAGETNERIYIDGLVK